MINAWYIMGEFHINLLNSIVSGTNFFNIMATSYLKPHILISTRLNNEGYFTSLIDNIFCNTNNKSISGTIAYDISDHLPIFFSTYNNKNNNSNNNNYKYVIKQTMHIRNVTKLNINKFINKI